MGLICLAWLSVQSGSYGAGSYPLPSTLLPLGYHPAPSPADSLPPSRLNGLPSTLLPLSHAYNHEVSGCRPTDNQALPSTLRPLPVTCKPLALQVSKHATVSRPGRVSSIIVLQPAERPSPLVALLPSATVYRSAANATQPKKLSERFRLTTDQTMRPAMPAKHRRLIAVPAQTVITVSLSAPLHSQHALVGNTVIVTVQEPVYVGPYLVIPAGSEITGRITDINRKPIKHGPNPYLVVQFQQLKRPGYSNNTTIDAELIAYKTGLKKEDYLWKLPEKTNRLGTYLWAAVEGAVAGFFANPLLGPPIGAAVSLLAAFTKDKLAHRGVIVIKPTDILPIAVQHAFQIPVAQT